ncbi:hypothetical protein [Virgibacillus oceani]|uniref:Peptidyl-prolyl cis-trans isomerase n=1 Tax=Virgibacillus oceani TaxID=1479511 RepID=A0A917LZX8_9BACI|nr:hypothetical protein [Virgibacillus oceani]GGG70078.1 hypothetical protein GCM10011398_12640 [Virgibacillus oceani]
MIVPITGNVTYKITLDPTVWIFDDRKILLEEAFLTNASKHTVTESELEEASKRWDRAVYQQKVNPPVNRSISRLEGEKILTNSYVMPINEFINHAEIKDDAQKATLVTDNGDVDISLDELKNAYFLFSIDGKPLKENGPVHVYYKDGSNKNNPITGVNKIVIV